MNNLNDAELANLIKGGDLNAFNMLYYRYFNAVYTNALKLTHDSALAKDIVQEVFIGLWDKRDTLQPEKTIAGWLFTCSYHKSINCLKKQFSAAKLLAFLPSQDAITHNLSSEDAREFQLKLLEEAIGHLSPQKRKVFELCKIEGKSYDQTAAELSLSKHTVKEYLSAALVVIKTYVRQHPDYITGSTSMILFAIFCIEFGRYL